MRLSKKIFFIFLFFFILVIFNPLKITINLDKIYSFHNNESIDRYYSFIYNGRIFNYTSKDYYIGDDVTKIQLTLLKDKKEYLKALKMAQSIGLTKKEIVNYFFPEINSIKDNLCKKIYPEDNYIEYIKNSCEINYIFGEGGIYLNQDDFYNKLYFMVLNNSKNIKINIVTDFYESKNDIKNDYKEKSTYSTNFSTSSDSRKNNIRVALESLDGIVLDEGEILSFNKITGIRNEKNGYQKAKIISNGTFIDGYGGGVCQVSTTLYNACLLAGLEIIEVHNHSLPVSYVEPSFDAMVNSGSSDLIIRNNTNGKIVITTSSKNDVCKIKIFGKKNRYRISKISEKIKSIPADKDIIDNDYLKYGDLKIEIGEEKRLSYPKDGFISNGYLCYYDYNEKLVKKEKIRQCKYNPTKGIIVKRVS